MKAKPGERTEAAAKVHHSAEVRGEEGNTVLIRESPSTSRNSDPTCARRSTVTAKVHCGRRAIGYVWFHDIISFVQSKVFRYL